MLIRLRDMRQLEMAPDGRNVAFTVQPQIATFAPPVSTIWVIPANGSATAHALTDGAHADADPRWSPDGRWIAFTSDRADGVAPGAGLALPTARQPVTNAVAPKGDAAPTVSSPHPRQLWIMSAQGSPARQLTHAAADVGAFAWSPDGSTIAFAAADAEAAADPEAPVVVDAPGRRARLWIAAATGGQARPITAPGLNVLALAWAPDGRRLALRVTDTARINDVFYHARLVEVDAASGRLGPVLLDHAAEEPSYAPDGHRLVVEEILSPGFIGLAPRVIDTASGAVMRLADAYPGLITAARWMPDGSITALSFEQTRSRLVRIDPIGGKVTAGPVLDGEAYSWSADREGGSVALALTSPDRPADVWVTVKGTAPHPITTINPEVAHWRLGRVEQVSWRSSRDGRTIYGVLVTPPGYVAGTRIKTVVQGHGGPEWAWWSGWLGSWHEWAQLLATHGYAVLLPNPRGSDGQGTAFARAVSDNWGGADYQDVLDGVDMLVAQHIADPARLGIGGWSYGGYLAAWAATHGARFKAAVVGAGPSDMVAMARITDTPDFPLGYFGTLPAHLDAYRRASPALLADHVSIPVLVLGGAEDTRVPPTLGLEFYRGMVMAGQTAQMVSYPHEPHWFHDPAHQQDVEARVLDWFDRYL